jgi:opacity protein-like surface antigen
MRKLLGTAALLTAFATSAMAADVAVRAPARYVAPVSVYNWTGFYVGIEGGGGWGFARQRDALGFNSGGYNVSGGLVGGTLGYNWQINRLVLGLEADEAWADIRGRRPGCGWNLRGTISSDMRLSDCRSAFKYGSYRGSELVGRPPVSFSSRVRHLSTPSFNAEASVTRPDRSADRQA